MSDTKKNMAFPLEETTYDSEADCLNFDHQQRGLTKVEYAAIMLTAALASKLHSGIWTFQPGGRGSLSAAGRHLAQLGVLLAEEVLNQANPPPPASASKDEAVYPQDPNGISLAP